MKTVFLKTIISLIFITLFFTKDIIYNFFDKDIFYPETVINNYKKLNENEESTYESANFSLSLTRVLYRDIYSFKKEITIYKGSNDGIKENMAVINEEGLVGIISKVNKETSVVKLLTNSDTSISIMVNNSYGLLKYENNNLIITNLTDHTLVQSSNEVYSSGLANLYKGINIGVVESKIESNLKNTFVVNSKVDFNNLDYLYIIKDVK